MSPAAEHLKDEGTRTQVVIAGGVAGLISRFVIAPLDVVKIRLQLQIHSLSDPLNQNGHEGPMYRGTFGTARSILREEGFTVGSKRSTLNDFADTYKVFWKGNIPAELLYVTYGACQFSLYRGITNAFQTLPPSRRLPDAAESFIAGALGGGLATAATYPLDLLRTRFAAQGSEKVYTGLVASIRDITRYEGPKGFFQGLTAAVGQIVPYMGLFFASYETLKLPLANLSLPLGSGDAVAGVLASMFSKSAVFPLDTIRKRLQVQGPTRSRYVHRNIPLYKGIMGTLQQIIKREGMRGLYRGLPVSLVKAAPASAMTMWTYERTMRLLTKAERTVEK